MRSSYSLIVGLLIACLMLVLAAGCMAYRPALREQTDRYQASLIDQGPLQRETAYDANEPNGVGLVRPVGRSVLMPLATNRDISDMKGTKTLELTLSEAIRAVLINSPEVYVISYDPALAEEEVKKQMAAFDPSLFGEAKYDKTDVMTSSNSEISRADVYQFESGLKQRSIWGSEWSASYALTNSWDDLITRVPNNLSRRYEPVMVFRLKQPLLRDAGGRVNMANLNISKLQHRIAMYSFQQKAEDLATQTIAAYWQLVQAKRDLSVFKELLDEAQKTQEKVQGRREIDASDVQIRQAIVSVNSRKAFLIQAEKLVKDAQDKLVRLMADPGVDLLNDVEIIPTSEPHEMPKDLQVEEMIAVALQQNPVMCQVRMQVDVADINLEVADNQKMPRLDLVGSASTQGLDRDLRVSQSRLSEHNYNSYSIGLSMEVPLGNRARKAEVRTRKLERLKAVTTVQNVADQVAVETKERLRRVQSSFEQIVIQEDTMAAATAHLQALEDSESIRERLTPEYLQLKLQAQEALATAQRARMSAVVDYNLALAQLAQITGRVLEVHQVGLSQPEMP